MTNRRPPTKQQANDAASDPRFLAAVETTWNRDPNWDDRARCRDAADADLFFPNSDDDAAANTAKRFCLGCPVGGHCLATALSGVGGIHGVGIKAAGVEGVWGATTKSERWPMLVAWNAVTRVTP